MTATGGVVMRTTTAPITASQPITTTTHPDATLTLPSGRVPAWYDLVAAAPISDDPELLTVSTTRRYDAAADTLNATAYVVAIRLHFAT